jgi:hypothetical protein
MAPDASTSQTLAPFLIEPRFVGRVWGFHDLRPWYDRTAEGEAIGEVWLTGDDCVVSSGSRAGTSLAALFRESPQALLGSSAPVAVSPLLVKMIFAREKLSVQVHPDDRLAQKYGQPRGKTECWYALAAEPGAQVAAGLKPGVTMEQVRAGIHDGTLEESLNHSSRRGGRHDLRRRRDCSRDLAGLDSARDAAELRPHLPHVRLRAASGAAHREIPGGDAADDACRQGSSEAPRRSDGAD